MNTSIRLVPGLRAAFVVALVLSLAFGTAWSSNGKITGRVLDQQTGEALVGANIILTHTILANNVETRLSTPLGATSDPDGYYVILDVPSNFYVVTASIVGYTPVTQKHLKVDLDRTVTLNFSLSSTSIEMDQVVVTAKREIIKQDVSATQEVIGTTRLEQMPVTRLDEFVGRIKGVELVSGAEGNGLSVRGGAIRETDVRLDGISLQDPRTENSYLALNSTAVQEVQVLTGGFEAKYGGIRSGLLNVITKDGNRDRYTVSLKVDAAPANQKRYFGTSPWSNDSWIYRVYAGEYAMRGIRTHEDSMTVPVEFWTFKGWADRAVLSNRLDSNQKLELWKLQHPQYNFQDRPDYFIEGSITGPFPGDFIPFFGEFAERTTFLLGFKYEDSQLAFPVGPRSNYVDWNTQLKLTTALSDNMKLAVNGLYAKLNTSSAGRTTSYGGALVDQASSFGFLNSTESSVRQQAQLLGGASFSQIFNKSRLQYLDQRYIVGGAKLTHTLSNTAYYTVEFQTGFTDQRLTPFSVDTNVVKPWVSLQSKFGPPVTLRYPLPIYGSPMASTNYGYDGLNTFAMYGGPQRIDSSHTYVYQLKGDLTTQLGRHHQIETGFSARLQDLFVYTGTWFQSQLSYTPDTWQYFNATPLEVGAYIQDKIELDGLVLNAGLRLDYLNPMKKSYQVGFPLSDEYMSLYNEIYPNLPGAAGSYERWVALRALLENPPDWPQGETKVQTYISPRLGVAFPITESSKLYFNYGHFYQRPAVTFMYNMYLSQGAISVPTPDLDMARTVSYEFGYEQMLFGEFLVNVTAYYKDVRNEPLNRRFINYYQDNIVNKYFPDAYRDVRGIELRFERPFGQWVRFNAMYDHMIQSSGQSGLAQVFENRLLAKDAELRSPNQFTSEPRPRANVNLNIHSPDDFGPDIFGVSLLGDIFADFFFEWRDGGRMLLNSEEPDVKLRHYLDIVDTWNIDFRGSKTFNLSFGSIEFVVTIKNLTNNKFLNTDNMLQTQYSDYKNSLQTDWTTPKGNDKWGEWDKDHIKTGWYDAPIFLNPRRFIFGLRLNF